MINKIKDGFFSALSCVNHFGGYLINDPSTPNLSAVMKPPVEGLLKFSVEGMSMTPENSHERRALNCHMIIGNCLNKLQEKAKSPVKTWAASSTLNVHPIAGKEMNAYYDRRSLRFFYYPCRGRNIYFSDSSDIITHELGHAFLDAMRPDFWSVQSLEIWAFHEAFSDIVAMFNLMTHDAAVISVLDETGGDLRKSNVVSRLAEEVGSMIRSVTGDPALLPDALRDPAKERFIYVDPSTLPEDAPNNLLASECHSFGRVFSAAWYEIFVRFFTMYCESSDSLSAFKSARDSAFSILMHAVPASARTDGYFRSIARCMVLLARGKGERYEDIVSSVFSEWNILHPTAVMMQDSSGLRSRLISRLKSGDSVLKSAESTAICTRKRMFLKIGDLPIVSSLSVSPDIKIEVPCDSYYEFDKNGELVDMALPNEEAVKKSVARCLSGISGQIGRGKMWEVRSGVLKRVFIL